MSLKIFCCYLNPGSPDREKVSSSGRNMWTYLQSLVYYTSLMTEKWEPGMQRGEFARVQFNLPIRFRLE